MKNLWTLKRVLKIYQQDKCEGCKDGVEQPVVTKVLPKDFLQLQFAPRVRENTMNNTITDPVESEREVLR